MNTLCKNRSFSRTYGIIVLVIGLALMVGSPLWSQEGEQSEFVSELMVGLLQEGWTAEEVRTLVAQDVDWEQAQGANSDVVALALQFAKSKDEEMEPMEQALLAIELALAAIEMEAVGIGEVSIAITALEGVRDILTDIWAFRSGELDEGNLGDVIRTKMGEQVSIATREHARDRISERDLEALKSRPSDLVPNIPASEDGFPGSGYWYGGRP